MNAKYLATTVAAAFWRGAFHPVDPAGAERLGFRIAPDDIALGWADFEAGIWALLVLGRSHILAITPDGTAMDVALDGVLLGEHHHRVVASVAAGGVALTMETHQ